MKHIEWFRSKNWLLLVALLALPMTAAHAGAPIGAKSQDGQVLAVHYRGEKHGHGHHHDSRHPPAKWFRKHPPRPVYVHPRYHDPRYWTPHPPVRWQPPRYLPPRHGSRPGHRDGRGHREEGGHRGR